MKNLPLKHSPGIPDRLRSPEEAIADANRERALWREPLRDPAEFLKRVQEPLVGVATTAVLGVLATLWIVS